MFIEDSIRHQGIWFRLSHLAKQICIYVTLGICIFISVFMHNYIY